MVLNVHRKHKAWCLMSTENIRLIRDGEKGVWKWGKREIIYNTYVSLNCHHQNDSCIKMGSSEGHFNVSFIVTVRDKVTRLSTDRRRDRRAEVDSNRGPCAYHYTSLMPYHKAKLAHTATTCTA